jgi:hypothetical protein
MLNNHFFSYNLIWKMKSYLLIFGLLSCVLAISQPSISGFSPEKGPVGSLVTITGNNLGSTQSIFIGGTKAVPVAIAPSTVIAMIMPGTTAGEIIISTGQGTATSKEVFNPIQHLLPNGQLGGKIKSPGSLNNYEGYSVAISADGKTFAVAGATGGLSVFKREENSIKKESFDNDAFEGGGYGLLSYANSVALNADGTSLLIGAMMENSEIGYVLFFKKIGSRWVQQGPKLTASDAKAKPRFGNSVALSADGNTALIGGYYDNNRTGAAWIFVRKGNSWIQEGKKLVGVGLNGGSFGTSVSLSADGNTALIGAAEDNGGVGASWIFSRKNEKWSQEGGKLVGTGGGAGSKQGTSVSISADGNTALVGGPGANGAWIFCRKDNFWGQQGSKLTGSGSEGLFQSEQGTSVSLSANGNVAVIGGIKDNKTTSYYPGAGAAWVFVRNGNTWTQSGRKLVGTGAIGGAEQGKNVAVSADGQSILVGGWTDNSTDGACWLYTFIPPPVIHSFFPEAATIRDTVRINGANLSTVTEVSFGGKTAASFNVLSPTTINAILDSGATGDVKLTSKVGSDSLSGFTFNPILPPTITSFSPVSASQFDTITIYGTNFKWVSSVSLGGKPVISFNVLSPTTITAVVGSGSSGFVQLTAVGGFTSLSGFSHIPLPLPIIESFSPVMGKVFDTITITGKNFKWVTSVGFGSGTAASFKVLSPTTISAVVGYNSSGFVSLTTVAGNARLAGFSYIPSPGPSIISFSPTSANEEDTVMIYGNNFINIEKIQFGVTPAASFTVLSSTTIRSIVGSGSTGTLRVMGKSGGTVVNGFTFLTRPPTINSFSPLSGSSGDSIVIQGNNLKGITKVSIGGVEVQSFRPLSSTLLIAYVGAGNTGIVKIVSAGGADSLPEFTYVSNVPIISTFSNTAGPVGSLVTIKGKNLNSPKSILIGGAAAIPVSNDGSTLVAMVMPGSKNGIIKITTAGGEASSQTEFSVTEAKIPQNYGQQGSKILGAEMKGKSQFGSALALSADGNTAIIGGPYDDSNKGGAWIFVRKDSIWKQQGPQLIGSGAEGAALQGLSVALSADGNTAIIGGPKDNFSYGAAWIFTRKGGTWMQQGSKLVGSGGVGGTINQGTSVALSADGNTAIVGGNGDSSNKGSVWVFTRIGDRWIQEGNKFSGNGASGAASQGSSLALSADGNTAFIGGPMDSSGVGAIWVFTRRSGIWKQQQKKLVALGARDKPYLGTSISLSADGNTVLVGGNGDSSFTGAAWVFERKSDTWQQQGKKLKGSSVERNGQFGFAVSLSADGNTAIIGSYGTNGNSGLSFIYTRKDSTWTEKDKLFGDNATGASNQGKKVFISADAGTAIIGGPADSLLMGASWIFSYRPPPHITSFEPISARTTDTIRITGNNFNKVSSITLGGVEVESFSFVSSTLLTAVVGTGASGPVTVTSIYGSSSLSGFNFISDPPVISSFSEKSGPVGTLVNIQGKNLLHPTSLSIAGAPAIPVRVEKNNIIAMVGPGATSGGISISTAGGTANLSDVFNVNTAQLPLGQQGEKLTATTVGKGAEFGNSVAISADGNTAIVGAYADDNYRGAAFIYNRIDGKWILQGEKLIGSDAIGEAWQGKSVAINSDGTSVVVGGPKDNDGRGAVWFFIKKNGQWTQQGNKMVGSNVWLDNRSNQGWSVALSANGKIALVGGPYDRGSTGSVWVFTLKSDKWIQQGDKLAPNNASSARAGASVAISSDGKTAIIGGFGDDSFTGAAWIYNFELGAWKLQAKLVGGELTGPTSPIRGSYQGTSVAISADGNTAIIGGNAANNASGAFWAFYRTNNSWNTSGIKVSNEEESVFGQLGKSVSLSADGKTALVGALGDNNGLGAAWFFTRIGNLWKQDKRKIFGSGSTSDANQGISVSLSSDGTTAIMGGNKENNQGAVWIFHEAKTPIITSFSPSSASEGDTIQLIGRNFSGIMEISIGGTAPTSFQTLSSTTISVVVGNGSSGVVSLTSTTGSTSLPGFTFIPHRSEILSFYPKEGPVGSIVYIKGKKLNLLQKVSIGKKEAIPLRLNDTLLVAMVMPGAVSGPVELTNSANLSSETKDSFTITLSKIPDKQQGPKLVGTGAIKGYFSVSQQGYSLSISADGNTAIVGGLTDNNDVGGAWIFIRDGGKWSQQGQKLVGNDYTVKARQGESVAISADGNTAIVGGPADNNNMGAAWIFSRADNNWYQNGPKLVGTGGTFGGCYQGGSVSLSADGNTAAIGAYLDNDKTGAVWIFTKKSDGTWYQQGNKLIGTGAVGKASQGISLQLSANGNYLIVGGNTDSFNVGASWIFTRKGDIWEQQGPKLVGTGRHSHLYIGLGRNVSINADGTTAIVAGNQDNNLTGASWIFTRNGDNWTQQGPKLVGTGGIRGPTNQGMGVSVSADGNTAIVGGIGDNNNIGASWLFQRKQGNWAQHNSKLVGSQPTENSQQGMGVALSADGQTAIVGGRYDSNSVGATWVFANIPPLPSITSFTPTTTRMNDSVTIIGSNFLHTTSLSFGGISITKYEVINDTTIKAIVADVASGEVRVNTTGGTAALSGFTYIGVPIILSFSPTAAPEDHTITIIGKNLNNVSAVSLGGTMVSSFLNISDTSLKAVIGNGSTGSVRLTTPGGKAALGGFTFIPPTSLTDFFPKKVGKGNTLNIHGIGLQHVTEIKLGGIEVESFSILADTLIQATVGSGKSGFVSIKTRFFADSLPGFVFAEPILNLSVHDTTFEFGTRKNVYSAVKSYRLSGNYLHSSLNISAPKYFEISTSQDSGYKQTLVIIPTNGKIDTTQIFIRFKSDVDGLYSGIILHTTAGAVTKSVSVIASSQCDSILDHTPVINSIIKDSIVCFKDSLVLSATNGNYPIHKWNTGDTTKNLVISKSGKYSLQVGSNKFCFSKISKNLVANKNTNSQPSLALLSNKTLLSSPATMYRWFVNNILIQGNNTISHLPEKIGMYVVETSNDGVCWDRSVEFPILTLAPTPTADSVKVKVYPNPSSTGLFFVVVTLEDPTNMEVRVTITDATGIVLLQTIKFIFFGKEIKIPISLTFKGTVFVKIEVNGDIITKTVLLQ